MFRPIKIVRPEPKEESIAPECYCSVPECNDCCCDDENTTFEFPYLDQIMTEEKRMQDLLYTPRENNNMITTTPINPFYSVFDCVDTTKAFAEYRNDHSYDNHIEDLEDNIIMRNCVITILQNITVIFQTGFINQMITVAYPNNDAINTLYSKISDFFRRLESTLITETRHLTNILRNPDSDNYTLITMESHNHVLNRITYDANLFILDCINSGCIDIAKVNMDQTQHIQNYIADKKIDFTINQNDNLTCCDPSYTIYSLTGYLNFDIQKVGEIIEINYVNLMYRQQGIVKHGRRPEIEQV